MSVERARLARRAEWAHTRERGSPWLLKAMAWVSLRAGRRVSRLILHAIVVYFLAFAPRARRHALEYLARALGRRPRLLDRYRHLLYFATCIHDRVYLVNDEFERFAMTIEGEPLVRAQLASARGALLMGAHMGSFEMMRSVGRRQALTVVMAMYEENARKMAALMKALAPTRQLDVISLGQLDAMLAIAQRIEDGAWVGMLGDRTLADEPVQPVQFLGRTAHLPTGPMRAAALLRCPVIFMLGLYRGANRYHVVFEPLADFTDLTGAAREAEIEQAVARYAALLERYCRSDPYNWFNFFDFWGSGP